MRKRSYISPASGTLEIAFLRLGHPTVSITLDLGIPNFTIFSFKFPIPQGKPGDLQQLLGEAIVALLDEMTAFMLSTGYRKDVIAKVYALALACYKDMAAGGKQKGDRDGDPSMASTRGIFKLPMDFIDETQEHVVTAAAKRIERSPRVRAMEFLPARPTKPSTGDVLKAIRRYRFQNVKTQPYPLYIVVYDQMGKPKGTLTLGPKFHNELLKMQYKKSSLRKDAGQWGVRSYDGDSAHDLLDKYRKPSSGGGMGFDEPIPAENVKPLLAEIDDMNPSLDDPDGMQDYLAAIMFLLDHGTKVPMAYRTRAAGLAERLLAMVEAQGWNDPEERKQQLGREIAMLTGKRASLLRKAASLTEEQAGMVRAGGGMPIGVEEGMVWFNSPATGSTLVVGVGELTPEAVRDAIRASNRRFEDARKKRADYVDEKGNWAGEGGAASGILPVCPKTGRVCLAWRSAEVIKGNCWGTIGGAVKEGMSPADSARHELKEETGYGGQMFLRNAYVYRDGKFRYHNFIGEVPAEFGLRPLAGSSWETDSLKWMGPDELESLMESSPGEFHPGVIALFENSGKLIRGMCGKARKGDGNDDRTV